MVEPHLVRAQGRGPAAGDGAGRTEWSSERPPPTGSLGRPEWGLLPPQPPPPGGRHSSGLAGRGLGEPRVQPLIIDDPAKAQMSDDQGSESQGLGGSPGDSEVMATLGASRANQTRASHGLNKQPLKRARCVSWDGSDACCPQLGLLRRDGVGTFAQDMP